MATISSPGVGTNGLDVKSIISQLVALERKPLDNLKLQAATVNTKISAFGQIKSLVSTLSDAAGKLTSVTGWNAVSTVTSDSKFVTATAVGGTLPTSFNVQVQSLAQAQSTASAPMLPVGTPVGAGTIYLEQGKWSGGTFTGGGSPVEIAISASDSVSDIASKINGSSASVTATVLSDASGERLLLRSKVTGEDAGFNLTVDEGGVAGDNTDMSGLSRLTTANGTVTQAAADAKAKVNGIAVSSSTNTFATTISGVSFQVQQVTTGPIDVTVSKDNSAIQQNVEDFVKAYNAINQLLNDATKYDGATKSAGLLQGDSTAIALQNSLRRALQSVSSGSTVFQRLADVGVTQKSGADALASAQLGGELTVDTTKLNRALDQNPEEVKKLFRNTGGGTADGIAVQVKALAANLLSNDGFFKTKDNSLQLALKRISQDQVRGGEKVDAYEKRITQRYNALDTQLSSLNGLNAYIAQQVATWNKSSG